MSKPRQALYAIRDFAYTLALAVFGWVLADFQSLIAHPIEIVGSFFTNFWNVLWVGLIIFAYCIEMVFCPGLIRPRDEEPVPWRRWKGMLMEANLVPAIFCARLGVMQISHNDLIRYVGLFFFLVSMIVTILYGVKRSRKVKDSGDNSYCTSGIYKLIRYPERLAQFTYSLSVGFLFRSWLALVATFFLMRWLISWLGKVDSFLDQKYGMDWVNYRTRTKKMLPFLI